MNIYKKLKPFVSLVCAVSLLFSLTAIPAVAADTRSVTATASKTVKQGSTDYCYVYIDSTEDLAALDVTVHFDPAKVKINHVYNSLSCTLYDSVTNTDNIQFSYILDGKGQATKTRLFYFQYQVLSGADLGSAFFDITVGEAYDSSLNEIPVSGSRCGFTIAAGTTTKSCSIYGSSSMSSKVEQEFSLSWRFSTSQIASGSAVINYDPDLFEVVSVTEGPLLTGKLTDINTDLAGSVHISFVGTEYNNNTNFLSVTFRTIRNEGTTSAITFQATELMDKELNPYSANQYKTNVTIAYDSAYTGDAPEMRLDGTFSLEDMQITLVVTLEKNSHLGAGDFVITFDPALVTYASATKGFSPDFFNINDKNVAAGELKFHIVNLTDIVTEETVLTVVFDVNHPYSRATADFTLDGSCLTDSLTESILLDFVDDNVPLKYRVTFCDEDGEILQSGIYYYGDEVIPPDPPTKESDVYGTYTFAGWDQPVTECTADAVYTATYDLELTEYTVTFQDWDGSVLFILASHYGEQLMPMYEPYRMDDETYYYFFEGWDRELVCTGDMTITAVYTPVFIEYEVIFQDWDGTILSWDYYHYGDTVNPPADPTKISDETFTYTFTGWDMEVVPCRGYATYTALYDAEYIEYTVEFRNWDGTVLETHTYHYGDWILMPADPVRSADEMYSYVFEGWDTYPMCWGNMVITAMYTPILNEYTVEFRNWDGSILSCGSYFYGDVVTVPADPVRGADETYTYTFAGWDSEIVPCTGDTVYTAVFDAHYIDYTVTFCDWDGTPLSVMVYHYGDAVVVPDDPQRQDDAICSYSFAGWSPEVSGICTGDVTYAAVYSVHYFGFTLSGSVTSFGPANGSVTVTLLRDGVVIDSTVTTTGSYALKLPEPGSYTLTVSKENHATRSYRITVATEDITQNVEIRLIGDIDGNGVVNIGDANRANAYVEMAKDLTEYERICADVDGNGIVDTTDVAKINDHAAKISMLW